MLVVVMDSLALASGHWPSSGVGFPACGKFGSFKTCFVLGDLNKNGLVGDACRLLLETVSPDLCCLLPCQTKPFLSFL